MNQRHYERRVDACDICREPCHPVIGLLGLERWCGKCRADDSPIPTALPYTPAWLRAWGL